MSTIGDALRHAHTQHGDTLADHGDRSLLVVLLRHFGCALCREMVADVARHRAAIEAAGTRIAFVHMHPEAMAGPYFADTGLGDVLRVSDPQQRVYAAFALARVGATHWLSWSILKRYIDAIFRGGHRPGYVGGDVLQMPGAFFVHHDAIVRAFRPDTLSERFDVVWLVRGESAA